MMPVYRFRYGVPVTDVPRYVVDANPKNTISICTNTDDEVCVFSSLSQADTATLLGLYAADLAGGDYDG